MSKWISVKDRLPDKSGFVLVFAEGGYIATLHFSKNYGLFNLYDEVEEARAKAFKFDVTHWRPLPEPAKEDEE